MRLQDFAVSQESVHPLACTRSRPKPNARDSSRNVVAAISQQHRKATKTAASRPFRRRRRSAQSKNGGNSAAEPSYTLARICDFRVLRVVKITD